jgi:hypothetical protein
MITPLTQKAHKLRYMKNRENSDMQDGATTLAKRDVVI